MSKSLSLLAALLCSFGFYGCIQREPGPAELIGKGIDQMAEGMQGLSKDEKYGGGAIATRVPERDYRYDDYSREVPRDDPYYDPNDPNDRERRRREADEVDERRY